MTLFAMPVRPRAKIDFKPSIIGSLKGVALKSKVYIFKTKSKKKKRINIYLEVW